MHQHLPRVRDDEDTRLRAPVHEGAVASREAAAEGTTIDIATVSVSDAWTRFFSTQRRNLVRVHVLVGSKAVHLTVAIAQHLSQTGSLIQIYSDAAIFESRLAIAGGDGAGAR